MKKYLFALVETITGENQISWHLRREMETTHEQNVCHVISRNATVSGGNVNTEERRIH